MFIAINVIALALLVFFLHQYCFRSFQGLNQFFVSLIIGINVFFLFSSISFFLSLNLSLFNLLQPQKDLILLLSLTVIFVYLLKLTGSSQSISLPQPYLSKNKNELVDSLFANKKINRYLGLLALICVISTIFFCISKLHQQPHGEWDAWSIWNLKARFLYRIPHDWTIGLSPVINWSHPDYPLFLPSLIAKLWQIFNSETMLASHFIAVYFLITTSYVMFSVLNLNAPKSIGYIAVIVLFSSYSYIKHSVYLTADIPLANLLLISVCLFVCFMQTKNYSLFLLALLFLSATFWMKNEGQLLFCVFAICFFYKTINIFKINKFTALSLLAILPCIISMIIFKHQIPLANDLFMDNSLESILSRATDFTRYTLIISSFFDSVLGILKVNLIALFILMILFRKRVLSENVNYLFLAIFISILGYLAIYLAITPHDLTWHIATSMERILLHFYPSFIFVLFLMFTNTGCFKPNLNPTS